jgi:hypothetical protein
MTDPFLLVVPNPEMLCSVDILPATPNGDASGRETAILDAHSHPRSRAVAAASVRLRAPNLAIADER